jgi:hypothetical protein
MLVLSIACGRCIADFAHTYVTYHAGLASAMIAPVCFSTKVARIFIFGRALNAAIVRMRKGKSQSSIAAVHKSLLATPE